MTKKSNDKPAEKQFDLKQIELQMLQNMHERSNAQLFDFFSFIGMERLALTPNKYTSFRVEDGKLLVGQREPTPEELAEEENQVAVS